MNILSCYEQAIKFYEQSQLILHLNIVIIIAIIIILFECVISGRLHLTLIMPSLNKNYGAIIIK